MSNPKTPKPWPTLPSDEAAEEFVATADLTEYDWSQAEPVTHRFTGEASGRRGRSTPAMAGSALDRILEKARTEALSEREKGTFFEDLMALWLEKDPLHRSQYRNVKPFVEWAKEHRWDGRDTGIDLVAELVDEDGYAAIQCKFYAEDHRISKADLDSFLAASGKHPFKRRLFIDTTTLPWSDNAEATIRGQDIPVIPIDLNDLRKSPVRWEGFFEPAAKVGLSPPPPLRSYQKEALRAVRDGLREANRGKLIMACGTGKTLTALRIAEDLAGAGKSVLYCVPSLALMAQTVRTWANDAETPLRSFAVCSDTQVGKRRSGKDDTAEIDSLDLAFPATTNPERLAAKYRKTADADASSKEMTVVFATYQSIQVIADAQDHGLPEFDLIICDEAHRTTGVTLAGEDESNFVRVHNNDAIKGKKRLYMTATPRIFGDAVKAKADKADADLADMGDEDTYGEELFRYGFARAVEENWLSDYKVIVLAMDEGRTGAGVQRALADGGSELKLDDATRIVGCYKALSKEGIRGGMKEDGADWLPMRRALAFSRDIKTSKLVKDKFSAVVEEFLETDGADASKNGGARRLQCEVDHVDGTFNAKQRERLLDWLKTDADDHTCRILTNARCLSEGVDVPSLDAILFLHPRKSHIDVVQSVGRVMRRAEGKEMGYVILPVGIPPGIPPEKALNDNERYRVVWQILNALRAHDERLDATINQIALGQKGDNRIEIIGGGEGEGEGDIASGPVQTRMELDEEFSRAIMAKIVAKCGTREYWDKWATDIAEIAQNHITRLTGVLDAPGTEARKAFDDFLEELQDDLNEAVTEADAVEMLAQHIVTRPVFAALFKGHDFIEQNPVSRAMSRVLAVLDEAKIDKEASDLEGFYASVRRRAEGITDPQARQRLMVELYDKFFRNAFPRITKRLGIVYTPVEIVDFIIRSVDEVLRSEFGQRLASPGVHIIDPFTGTGTFIARLLQSGLIGREEVERKFRKGEIHANEIVLLAYYIAAINIEAAYHGVMNKDGMSEGYTPFEGICLTDTFRMYESDDLVAHFMPDNSERRKRQKAVDIRVIMGNPPYLRGKDDTNATYPELDQRIRETYAARAAAKLKNPLYDSYIRAIRWASDRIGDGGGIIAYVSGSGWIERGFADGMRECLAEEFSSLHIFHLRGDIRKDMLSKGRAGEGGNVFGSGSMTGAAISVLVKNPEAKEHGRILFHDIGNNLNREEKLTRIREFSGIDGISNANGWTRITPDEHHDWLNQRDRSFDAFIKLGDKKDKSGETLFGIYSLGVVTNRDAWCCNASREVMADNMRRMITFYNREAERVAVHDTNAARAEALDMTPAKISWTRSLKQAAVRRKTLNFERDGDVRLSLYRPFTKQWLYFSRPLNEMIYKIPALFPEPETKNRAICVTSTGARAGFSVLMTDVTPSLDTLEKGQAFALRRFDETAGNDKSSDMFTKGSVSTGGASALTRTGLAHFQATYPGEEITEEDVFYYVYGLLHSPDYRTRYANNLSKELPRIPCVKRVEDFRAFRDAGRALGDLHVNYESAEPCPVTIKEGDLALAVIDDPEDFYRVRRMQFGGKEREKDRSTMVYNANITMENIPQEAWEYVVNGKPALEWVMERQTVRTDRASGIVNDANRYAVETMGDPAWPLKLFQKVMTVSIETMKIVRGLPKMEVEG